MNNEKCPICQLPMSSPLNDCVGELHRTHSILRVECAARAAREAAGRNAARALLYLLEGIACLGLDDLDSYSISRECMAGRGAIDAIRAAHPEWLE